MNKEKELVSAFKKGDVAALERVITEFTPYVCTVVRNFSRGMLTEDDIDETTADVFIRLWQSRQRLDPKCGLKPYISAVARNAVKNRFRALHPPTDDIDNIEDMEAANYFDLEKSVELTEALKCLDKGLMTVSAEEREIFMRFYFYGEKTSDIALTMELKDGTVRSKLTRTREKLKNYLKERGFDNV
ncbi:MAG: sigma-70 family RNA polymerase sigma factor [Ruminiclostridium sp.]|nr:sigma-70 family RNA polymerase sigma factor [Ruminiclostridium sp.]